MATKSKETEAQNSVKKEKTTTTKKATTKKSTTAKATATTKKATKAATIVDSNEKELVAVKKTAGRKKTTKSATAVKKEETNYKETMKVLFAAGEVAPFIKTGGLADVVGSLPQTLVEKGIDARVVIPMYRKIINEYKSQCEFLGFCYVGHSWRNEYAGLYKIEKNGVKYYFLDNERYFNRDRVYGEFDDAERFSFFSKAVLECLKLMDFKPDIIHANDWHTGLVPVYLDCFYRNDDYAKNARTVFTIHNIEFQGQFNGMLIGDILGLNYEQVQLVSYKDCANFMKGGIESASRVTTVSNTYAHEILDPTFGYGMQDILNARQYKLSGIVNGIDTKKYDPKTDKYLVKNYDLSTVSERYLNKLALQEQFGLERNKDIPLIAMVGRLTHQKGIDLVMGSLDRIMSLGVQLVILGTGDPYYEDLLRKAEDKYRGRLIAYIGFSNEIASKLYASSDLFLMPSKFEPCGLSQIIAMRYGSIPVVRETGGLKDTVVPYNYTNKEGTGFTFKLYNTDDLSYAVERAVGLFRDYKSDWETVLNNAMSQDYSWDKIADKYIDLYKNC